MKLLLNQRFGLGNQMFQYAAALYFADKYGAQLEVIRQTADKQVAFGRPRLFLLSQFAISAKVRDRTLLDRLLRSESKAVERIAAPIRSLYGVYQHDPLLKIFDAFQPTLPFPEGTRRIYLNGHFQVHQYADTLGDKLRQEFTILAPASGKNLDVLQEIQAEPCPVSLHVRLGDYKQEWAGQNLMPAAYYERAIEAMLQFHPRARLFVFSDDIAGARETLPGLRDATFVNHNTEANPHEDLRLMSACKHHILANSSFSWWGAWLNPDPEKTVLVPDPWYVTDPHPHLLPAGWRKIAR